MARPRRRLCAPACRPWRTWYVRSVRFHQTSPTIMSQTTWKVHRNQSYLHTARDEACGARRDEPGRQGWQGKGHSGGACAAWARPSCMYFRCVAPPLPPPRT